MDSFIVLKSVMDLGQLVGEPESMWESIYCSSKAAYGCGKHGQKLVDGLKLYVRRVEQPDLSTSIAIRLSDEAFGSIEAELGDNGMVEAKVNAMIAHQGLLVLIVEFLIWQNCHRIYYLVYDTADASLFMVPDLPRYLSVSYTPTPVPRRLPSGGVELVLVASMYQFQPIQKDYLCLCTPATRANPGSDINGLWETKEKPFPELPGDLSVDVVFWLDGKAFWADPSRGLVYSDSRTWNSVVEFNFIPLPRGYETRRGELEDYTLVPRERQTIGCTEEGCVKFICFDCSAGRLGEERVKMWTLDLAQKKWKAELVVLWKDLWNQVDFMEAEMSNVEPCIQL